MLRKPLFLLFAFLLVLAWNPTKAGLAPETTLLVVNADSPLSLTVANLWMELRPIPQRHVVWLHDIPTLETLSMEDLRNRILLPIQSHLQKEELTNKIDTIVYSSDFPFAVDIRKTLKENGITNHRYLGGSGALTGLAFFANDVLAGRADFLGSLANRYFRREIFPNRSLQELLSKEASKKRDKARQALEKGKTSEAKQLLDQLLERYAANAHLHVLMARVLAMLDQEQAAMKELEAAFQAGWDNSLKLRNDKWLAPLKKSKDFRALVRRIDAPRSRFEPPRGFRNRYHWSRDSIPGTSDLDRYYLSALLAYTGQRGNSLPEIEQYLTRAAHSDGSHPDGTVYLMENRNIRTEARQPWFGETCALLKSIGHRCRILTRGKNGEDGILPKKRWDIIGLATGTKIFNWKRSGSQLLPGAFADSFTSYAGDFDSGSQTKLTEFLRQGAAASSGAVVEPFSFAEKFPLPLLHYYYGLGYSLGESWYMSVASPYQTILVGDPLTQPYADPVRLSLKQPDPAASWKGRVQIPLAMKATRNPAIDHYELWVDGRPVAEAPAGQPLTWDTTQVADGYHELHLVAVEPVPREGRSSRRYWIRVNNHNLTASLVASTIKAPYATPFILEGTAPSGSRVSIRQGTRELLSFTSDKETWESILPTSPLGLGKVTLQAEVITPSGEKILSNPLSLTITQSRPSRSHHQHRHWQPGLLAGVIYSDEKGALQSRSQTLKALNGKLGGLLPKGSKTERIQISGEFETKARGFYQFTIRTRGKIQVEVDGNPWETEIPGDKYGLTYLPLFLEKGWHSLEILPSSRGAEKLQVLLSGTEPPVILDHKRTRSPKPVTKPPL